MKIEKILRKIQLRDFRRDLKKVYPGKTLKQIDHLIEKVQSWNEKEV